MHVDINVPALMQQGYCVYALCTRAHVDVVRFRASAVTHAP